MSGDGDPTPAKVVLTILVADDDASSRCVLTKELTDRGYEVVEAVDGTEALEAIAVAADGHGPALDLVLLDVCMPGLSGLGILRLMRRFEHPPPTILVTGFSDRSVDVLARNLGVQRLFHKPIDLDEVMAAVAEATTTTTTPPAGQER